jgi:formylglycine-generating enzyme required for sulfatase activity
MLGIIGLLVRPYVEEAIAKSQAQDQSKMVTVPTGSIDFQLVDTFETINLPEYNIELHPVTNHVYGLCVKVSKCTPPIGSADFNDPLKQDDPVVFVTITQAAAYCEWIGRRQPSAPEWELASQIFAKSDQKEELFLLSDYDEWTSSYVQPNSQGISGEWDGQIVNLNIVDWYFLQEKGSLSSTGDLELYTNPSGAFDANASLGFRCANK